MPSNQKKTNNFVMKKLRRHPKHKKKTKEELEVLGFELTNPEKIQKYFSHLLKSDQPLATKSVDEGYDKDYNGAQASAVFHKSDPVHTSLIPVKLTIQKVRSFFGKFGFLLRHQYGPFHAALEVGGVVIEWGEESFVEPRFIPVSDYELKADVTDQSEWLGQEMSQIEKPEDEDEKMRKLTTVNAQIIGRVVGVILDYNCNRKFNVINCSCQTFVDDVMAALGINKPVVFSGRLQTHFDLLKQGKIQVPPEFDTHSKLDEFTEANIGDLSKHDMEYLQCLYFSSHRAVKKSLRDCDSWKCGMPTCKSELIDRLMFQV